MTHAISVKDLCKSYNSLGQTFHALKNVSLNVQQGEIFALLGPNGAGKTTLIGSICGMVRPSSGTIEINGFDAIRQYRQARSLIGLVPQELTTDAFESVWQNVNFSRGLFGKAKDHSYVEKVIRQLSLWDKKDNMIMTLSGGMKRRVLIAKALAHEPKILFLDEPTAGVDVELRQSMWEVVRKLRESGVTIFLTTHYIEEAEEMADRVGVIQNGKILITEEKNKLLKNLGTKQMIFELCQPLRTVPESLKKCSLDIHDNGYQLVLTYDNQEQAIPIGDILKQLAAENILYKDIHTKQSSLEDVFVEILRKNS